MIEAVLDATSMLVARYSTRRCQPSPHALLKPLMERLRKSKRALAVRVFDWDSWLSSQNRMRRS